MFKIRPAEVTDAEALASIYHNTIRHVNIRDYSAPQISAWAGAAPDPERWRARFTVKPEMLTFVACENGEVLGFADLELNGHVDCVYVHHEHQGRGVASQLMARIEQEAIRRGLTRLFSEASITALPFFQRRGFKMLAEQEVEFRGAKFKNYRVEKVGIAAG